MASKHEMRVKVVAVNDAETVGANGFVKRVLEGRIEGEYPEDFAFEFVKDKVALLDDVLEDTYVTVHYNIRGRKVDTDKNGVQMTKPMFFVTLNGWKVEV
jgi:hypothetical protein